MKKLIVMGLAAFAAIAANAAAFQWSALAIPTVDAASSAGMSAYLVDASKVSRATMIAALESGDFQYMKDANYLLTTTTTAQGTTGISRINLTSGTASEASYDAYTIVLDGAVGSAKNFFATQELHADTPDLGNVAFAFQSQAGKTWTAVAPEPTSGLLMLVGLGALALRRRKA